MTFISCKDYVDLKKEELKEIINIERENIGRPPKLCVVQVGNNDASNSYIKGKKNDCSDVGIDFEHIHIPNTCTEEDFLNLLNRLNDDDKVDGILVQHPLPENLKKIAIEHIDKEKDVDGFNKCSNFIPCTPKGIINYLKYNQIHFQGNVCTVIGRSEIVGKPLVNLLIDEGATVISCNSKTRNIKKYTRESDIVISAIGQPNFFDEEYFRDGQVLIDVGINRDNNGKLCGDITSKAKEKALLATPVPSGVGLLTRYELLENVFQSYTNRNLKIKNYLYVGALE